MKEPNSKEPASSSKPVPSRDMVTRWGGRKPLFDNGFVAVPTRFLECRSAMKPLCLTPTEALFVIDLMAHKWSAAAPYPGFKRLAKWMGKSEGYVRRVARSLEIKGFLVRRHRRGYTNEFDLTPLFDRLEGHLEAPPPVIKTRRPAKRRKAK
jgi:hypothetical protein